MNRVERIKAILTQKLAPGHMELADDSARHAGHSGAAPGGETHYTLVIESAAFSGLSPVKRHQLIYAALADEFKTGLHALSITARAPKEH